MNLFDLNGKVAVVTGGNGGIGLGIAQGIASCGASVVISGRNTEKGASALDTLHAQGVQAAFIRADVTKNADCVDLISHAEARFGRVDILVNNAGFSINKTPQDYTEEDWNRVMDTNLTSAFRCSQAAYHAMVKLGAGKIINIISIMSLLGARNAIAYGTSKGGMVSVTRAMASAWASANIQVNAVLPGFVDTDMTRGFRQQMPVVDEKVVARTPQGRWAAPKDLAGIAAFLAGPASDFVTGSAIVVDGGFTRAALRFPCSRTFWHKRTSPFKQSIAQSLHSP